MKAKISVLAIRVEAIISFACLITVGYNQMLQSWLLNSLIDFKAQSKKKFTK